MEKNLINGQLTSYFHPFRIQQMKDMNLLLNSKAKTFPDLVLNGIFYGLKKLLNTSMEYQPKQTLF